MARIIGGGLKKLPGLRSGRLPEETPLAVSAIAGGMIADVDPADIEDNQTSLQKNSRIRRGKTSRRFGKSTYLPTKPNSNPAIRLFDYKIGDTSSYSIRLSDRDAYFTAGAAWTQFIGVFTGRPTDIAVVLGTLVVANGIDRLRCCS